MQIGIDAGGTFTDFVVLHDTGTLEMFKLRSDPDDPAAVILSGMERALRRNDASRQVEVLHGSTVATNTLLERKGARTGFVTTTGFRDLLAIGRQNRTSLYSLCPEERVNLVPRELCFEWNGDVPALQRFVEETKAESIAICLLHAYEDPKEEKRVESACEAPYLCRSSEIAPEFREYERASTTVLNAYVGPLMNRYLSRLEMKCPYPIQVMQSNGGLLSAGEARKHAVRTILSGPAGGVVGAGAMARRAGWEQAIAFDMGGTSTDVSLVERPSRFSTEAWVEGLPIRIPMLDIHTVGAGGGSLASVDAGGRLRVGPESAGSRPGPACYGTGRQATVTDANVVLRRILPEHFLDGGMPIDVSRAEDAVCKIGHDLSMSAEDAALAIVRIANSNMERAIRFVTVEQGRDPRDFPLLAFGGCGGLHACEIAAELGISTVIFPAYAGALSALGMLLAAPVCDFAASALGRKDSGTIFDELRESAVDEMPGADLEEFADIRYRGQSYELTVGWNGADPRGPFENAYRQIYGVSDPQREIEVVTARVRATQPKDTSWFGFLDPDRGLASARSGPALLFDYGSTIFIPSGWRVEARSGGALVAFAENVNALPSPAQPEHGPHTG